MVNNTLLMSPVRNVHQENKYIYLLDGRLRCRLCVCAPTLRDPLQRIVATAIQAYAS